MKVLLQAWWSGFDVGLYSLSLNADSLKISTREARGDPHKYIEPEGEPKEITIPDDSVFAEMVATKGTIFLHDDEMDIVQNAPEYQ